MGEEFSSSQETAQETTLLRQIRLGDAVAFQELVRQYYPALMGFATRMTGDVSTSEDILQDIWLRIWRGRAGLSADQSLRAYLFTAVRRGIMDAQRTRRREDTAMTNAASIQVTTHDPDVLSHLEGDELATIIERTIDQFPDRCREAWALVREQGMSHAEAAAVMEISVNTVRAQMAKALGLLREALQQHLRS